MKAKLHQFWQAFRPVLIGWVTVALLLPTLLAVAPSTAAASAVSFSEICSAQNANLPDDHKNHSQDCPCCVLSGAAHMGLLPRDAVEILDPPRRQDAVFIAKAISSTIAETHVAHALARGPPNLFNI
ncbi:MAG: hypothetical protein ABI230_00820 [Aestuariivirga sp.]